MDNAAPAQDNKATGWFSEAKYRRGASTCRNEARATRWYKRQFARCARRNDRRELMTRIAE